MSGIYTPTPRVSTTYPIPETGDNKNAASVTDVLHLLADSLARLNWEGFQWLKAATTPGKVQRGSYSQVEQSWYGCGSGALDLVVRSQDHDRSWVDLSGTVGLVASEQCHDLKVASDGAIVIITNGSSKNIYYAGAPSTYGGISFTHVVGALSHISDGGMVEFDSHVDRWLAVFRSASAGMKVNTAELATPAAWTDRSANLPAAWTAYTGTTQEPAMTTRDKPSRTTFLPRRTIAVFFDDDATTNLYRIARSDDGGITWSETPGFAGVFNAETVGKPAYDPIFDCWFIVGARTTGTDKTEVFRSDDDGVTWTSTYTNTTGLAFQDLVSFNGVLVAVNVDGRIYASHDLGSTFFLTGRNPITTPARPFLRLQNGQAIVFNSEDNTAVVSFRMGAEGA